MSRRQLAAAQREDRFWAARIAAARDGAARAAVMFDRLRARIAAAPVRQRESAWAAVTTHLVDLHRQLDRQLRHEEERS